MSSTYNKLIKDATKAKPGAPKPKYIDPILASTFSQDGSLADVCRSLALRLRETNSITVFKSLLIIHTMIRNGAVDNVLSHLSADQAGLKLKNVSQGGNWQGEKWLEQQMREGDVARKWKDRYGGGGTEFRYDAPPSLPPYAAYLDERIRSFRELKHDVIRSADGSSRSRSNGGDGANRLRRLKVEKGLLREVGYSQRVLSRLLDCSFFQDNLSDDLNLSAFRMVLKDVLALYTAINEGVINILEHYFEMSHSDASKALDIYKRFCRHTEKVVAYLAAARKASHSLNMTVPQLKHAPVSLAGALEEYLNDPAFEKNRREYKENKRVADGLPEDKSSSAPATNDAKITDEAAAKKGPTSRKVSIQEPSAEEKTRPPKPPTNNQAIQDFFSTLESENGPEANGSQWGNAFSMAPQATGMAWFGSPNPGMMGGGGAFGDMGMQPQMTGYNPFTMMPQQTAMGMQPTGFPQQQQPFLQPQQTAMPGGMQGGFLAPQQTGYNPFRQSVMPQATGFAGNGGMVPQMTGMGPSGAFDATPFTQQVQQQLAMQRMQKQQQEQNGSGQANGEANGSEPSPATFSPPPQSQQQAPTSPTPKPLFAQKTGSRNPFAPAPGEKPPTPPPAVPKGPSLAQLAFSGAGGFDGPTQGGGGGYSLGAGGWNGNSSNNANGTSGSGSQTSQQASSSGLVPQKTGLLGSVASEFTSAGRMNSAPSPSFGNSQGQGQAQPNASTSNNGPSSPFNANSSALNPLTTGFSSLSVGGSGGPSSPFPSSANTNTNATSSVPSTLQPQPTGFGGSTVKPFKPESSFGAELASQYTGMPAQGAQQQQQQQGQQMGSANPFAFSNGGAGQGQPQQGQSTGAGAGQGSGQGAGGFGSSLFASNGNGNGNQSGGGLNSQPTGFASAFGSSFAPSFGSGVGGQQQQQPGQQTTQGQGQGGAGGAALQSQPTGFFAGSTVKPFQPTSAFGSSAFGGSGVGGAQGQQQPGQGQGQGQVQTGTFF
ncbi:ANTH-domain-containing protein [Microstroma glucosiphilum]|uniref:ANTH-domain-containing protein n=1 Tax=Pseudomicrostroma glucosiphilum TaxID=1684307 RepID=A0A316UB70_9BASI|nr:ANTH-domain-containing protein [Pseudomicrostroma glucosiphilum]PWN21643.1 ANTH-domain-containing protein [Pseudomicrostroma glucosiphilum]